MNQSELISKVVAISGESKKAVESVLKVSGDVISAHLQEGEDVVLPVIGKLSVTQRAAREGRNPATGEAIKIPARKAVKFSPSKLLKDAVNPAPTKKGKK